MRNNLTLEESLEIIKASNRRNANKDLKIKVSLHNACHPKDITRKMSHAMFNETCKEKFRKTLKIDECTIACHNPDKTRKLTT